MKKTLVVWFVLLLLSPGILWAGADTDKTVAAKGPDYDALARSLRVAGAADRAIPGLSPRQAQVRAAWETGKTLDEYLLAGRQRASEVVDRLAADLGDDPSRLYYALQFYRTYPDKPPALDLHWGFYQYFLAVNDPREREALIRRAFAEKWNWDRMREEVKRAGRDNKEYVFTDTPAGSRIYRVMTAKRGPFRGEKILDLGLGNDYKPPFEIKFKDYAIVRAAGCEKAPAAGGACRLEEAPGGEKGLFAYPADVIKVFDGDTFQATIDLGFGVTTRQTFRLWGLDAPEINTREGRRAQKFAEELLGSGPVTVRAMRAEKYGRFLADVWVLPDEKSKSLRAAPSGLTDKRRVLPAGKSSSVYVNRALIGRGLAAAQERQEKKK